MPAPETSFKNYHGLVSGLPPKGDLPFRISILCFASQDPEHFEKIMSIEDSQERVQKFHQMIQNAVTEADPRLAQFAYTDLLKNSGVSFYIGDLEENMEEFIADNSKELETFLQSKDYLLLGGLTFSRVAEVDQKLTGSALVSEFIAHISQNYFSVENLTTEGSRSV